MNLKLEAMKKGKTAVKGPASAKLDPDKKKKNAEADAKRLDLEVAKQRAKLEERFAIIDPMPYARGTIRGRHAVRTILTENKLHKKPNSAVCQGTLNQWLYRRHALKLGYLTLKDVPSVVLANSLIREGTKIRFHSLDHVKNVLKEIFRYGTSQLLDNHYLPKDAARLKIQTDNENNRLRNLARPKQISNGNSDAETGRKKMSDDALVGRRVDERCTTTSKYGNKRLRKTKKMLFF